MLIYNSQQHCIDVQISNILKLIDIMGALYTAMELKPFHLIPSNIIPSVLTN